MSEPPLGPTPQISPPDEEWSESDRIKDPNGFLRLRIEALLSAPILVKTLDRCIEDEIGVFHMYQKRGMT